MLCMAGCSRHRGLTAALHVLTLPASITFHARIHSFAPCRHFVSWTRAWLTLLTETVVLSRSCTKPEIWSDESEITEGRASEVRCRLRKAILGYTV